MSSLAKNLITYSNVRYCLRKKQYVDWYYKRFWISRLMALFTRRGQKNLVLNHYYKALFILKFDLEPIQLLQPLYQCLRLGLPLIGFVAMKRQHKKKINPKLRTRIERPLQSYNLVFRWVRSSLKSVTSVYLHERFQLLTEALAGSVIQYLMAQKLKHYETAIANLQYLRIRRFKKKKRSSKKILPLARVR